MPTLIEWLGFFLVLLVVAGSCWGVCSVMEFIIETPKQLKRIADALEWRNKHGK